MKDETKKVWVDGNFLYQNYDVAAKARDEEIAFERRMATKDKDDAESLTKIEDSKELQDILQKLSKMDVTKKEDHVLRQQLAYEAGNVANKQGVSLNKTIRSMMDIDKHTKFSSPPGDQMLLGAFGMKNWAKESGEWSYFTCGVDLDCDCDDYDDLEEMQS